MTEWSMNILLDVIAYRHVRVHCLLVIISVMIVRLLGLQSDAEPDEVSRVS